MKESWIKPFAYLDQRRQMTLASAALAVVGLFLTLEIVLWSDAQKAVRTGQRVEVLIGYGKSYARLRENTKEVIEMTARTQQALVREQAVSGTQEEPATQALSDGIREQYIAKNTETLTQIDAFLAAAQERYHMLGLKWVARK